MHCQFHHSFVYIPRKFLLQKSSSALSLMKIRAYGFCKICDKCFVRHTNHFLYHSVDAVTVVLYRLFEALVTQPKVEAKEVLPRSVSFLNIVL